MEFVHELLAKDIAVSSPVGSSLKDFPRPSGWHPDANLQLLTECRLDGIGPRYRLPVRNREEDAATADIRMAILNPADGGSTMPVVLKLQRVNAAQSSKSDTVELRFNREQRALQELTVSLADDRKFDLPRTLQPDGLSHTASEAIRIPLPLVFCLAGRHALSLNILAGDREDLRNDALREVVGRDAAACEGCSHFNSQRSDSDDNPIPLACRPWMVTHRDTGRWDGLILPSARLLILTDMGLSLQNHLEIRLTPESDAQTAERPNKALQRKINALYELSKTLGAIHKSGWLHLDLNLDNLCISDKKPNRIRLIDFGHAEPKDTTVEAFRERIPLRRVDFAAAEMQLRSFPLRIRKVAEQVWEAWGLPGWPREWWPAPGDILELVGNEDYPLLQIHQTESTGHILCMHVYTMDKANRVTPPFNQIIDATVYRSPAPSSDLCSFGLIALCWLSDLQRPVLFRNELAVFERAITARKNQSLPDGATLVVTDDNWFSVYRAIFGRYSFLLDDIFDLWNTRLKNFNTADDEAVLWKNAFIQCVRIAIKCVVRVPEWSYCSPDTDGFNDIATDLKKMSDSIVNGTMPKLIQHSMSFEGFYKLVISDLQTALTKEQRRSDYHRTQRLQAVFTEVLKAKDALMSVLDVIQVVLSDLANINKQLKRVSDYRVALRHTSWVQREILSRVKGWFTGRYYGNAASDVLLHLQSKVKELADHVRQQDRTLLEGTAKAIASATNRLPELIYHLRRARYSPYERKRVDAITKILSTLVESLTPAITRIAIGDTVEHDLYQNQLKVLLELAAELVIHFDGQVSVLDNKGQVFVKSVKKDLPVVIQHDRRPAEIILSYAWNEHEQLLKALRECAKFAGSLKVCVDQLHRASTLNKYNLTETQKAITELKVVMLKLIERKPWTESNSILFTTNKQQDVG